MRWPLFPRRGNEPSYISVYFQPPEHHLTAAISLNESSLPAAEAALLQAEAELRRLRADFGRLLAFVDHDATALVEKARQRADALLEEVRTRDELIAEQRAFINTLKAAAARAPGWRHPPSGKRRAGP